MATALVKGGVPDTDCSVCHEAFKEPKIMPCGHVVCRPCLVSWLGAQPQADCPLCRCAVLETEGQPGSLEEKVGALPTDLALAELVEARALLNKDHTCCVCEDVAATALCLHCGDMLCASCRKAHEKMTVSKHHKVADLSSLTPDMLAASRPSPCSSHPNEACTLFCPSHDIAVCVLCATAKHRSCPDIKDLDERTEEARAMLAGVAASLIASESELSDAIQRLNRHVQDAEEHVQAAIAHIKKTCDRLEACVQSCRKRMTDLAFSAGSDIKKRAKAAVTRLQKRKSQVTAHTNVVSRAEGSKAHATVSTMSAVMRTRVQQLDCGVTLPASDALTTMTFSIDEGVVSTVEKALAQLGQVHLVPADHVAEAVPSSSPRVQSAVRGGAGARKKTSRVAAKGAPSLDAEPGVAGVVKVAVDLKVAPGVKVARQAGHFTFHQNHGRNIVLSADYRTATYTGGLDGGIVVSREPVAANVLYQVRLDEWGTGVVLAVGVLTVSPDSVTLPGFSDVLRPVTAVSTWGVKRSGAEVYVDHPLSSVIKGLRQGERVGVSVDTSRRLHLHVNGEDRGVLDDAPVTGCHVLIDLWCNGSKVNPQVTALPPTLLD